MAVREYTLSHTGSILEGDLTLAQNQVSPQLETTVMELTCPKKFEAIDYVGRRDAVRFVPRTLETASGDGATTTFALTSDIQPVAGETDLADQDYPAVVAVVGGTEAAVASVDYAANEVTLESAPATGTDNVKLFPIITEGTMKFRGVDQLGVEQGPLDKFGFPLYRFHDLPQLQAGFEFRLSGGARWTRNETVEVVMDSPRQIVWEDADYPEAYVSTFEMDCEIEL